MFPTSSRTLLVGRNARSATARINGPTVLPGSVAPPPRRAFLSLRHQLPEDQAGTVVSRLSRTPQTGVRRRTSWYVRRALSGWRMRSCGLFAGIAMTLVLGACGGGSRQDAKEPTGNFTVDVAKATFPPSQRLSEHTHLVIAVRNMSSKTIPNVAISICNVSCAYPTAAGEGTSAQPFSTQLNQPYVPNPSRPVWIVDRPP